VQWLRTRIDVRQGFGGHHGVVADLSADSRGQGDAEPTLSGGPRMTFASTAALTPYFSIDAGQSAASGLPSTMPPARMRSYGVGALARY